MINIIFFRLNRSNTWLRHLHAFPLALIVAMTPP